MPLQTSQFSKYCSNQNEQNFMQEHNKKSNPAKEIRPDRDTIPDSSSHHTLAEHCPSERPTAKRAERQRARWRAETEYYSDVHRTSPPSACCCTAPVASVSMTPLPAFSSAGRPYGKEITAVMPRNVTAESALTLNVLYHNTPHTLWPWTTRSMQNQLLWDILKEVRVFLSYSVF